MGAAYEGRELAAAKGYTAGTHRTRSPADTLAAWAPLMPRLGITRLADITGLDVIGLPVIQAVRPNARSVSVSANPAARKSTIAQTVSFAGWMSQPRSKLATVWRSARVCSQSFEIRLSPNS